MRPQLSIYMEREQQSMLSHLLSESSPFLLCRDDVSIQYLYPATSKQPLALLEPATGTLADEVHRYASEALGFHPRSELLIDNVTLDAEGLAPVKAGIDYLQETEVSSYVVARSLDLDLLVRHLIQKRRGVNDTDPSAGPMDYFVLGFNPGNGVDIVNSELVDRFPLLGE